MLYTNYQDVERVARELLDLDGSTTTLEVKEELRALGYFATQDMVSSSMLQIEEACGDIISEESGFGYRIYAYAPESEPAVIRGWRRLIPAFLR